MLKWNWKRALSGCTFCAALIIAVVLGHVETGPAQSSAMQSELMEALASGQAQNTLVDAQGNLWVGNNRFENCSTSVQGGLSAGEGPDIINLTKECKYRICGVGSTSNCTDCPLDFQINDTLCGEECTSDEDCPGTFNMIADCPGGGRCGVIACFQGCLACP